MSTGALTSAVVSLAAAIAIWGWLIGPIIKSVDNVIERVARVEAQHLEDMKVLSRESTAHEREDDKEKQLIVRAIAELRTEQAVQNERLTGCEQLHSGGNKR